jgi:hypothetical protein
VSGLSKSECGACGEVFGSVQTFDAHHDVDYSRTPAVQCKRPERIGLVLDAWRVWRTPADMQVSAARVAAMNTARETRKHDG